MWPLSFSIWLTLHNTMSFEFICVVEYDIACVCVHVCDYVYAYVCMCICVYVCANVHIHMCDLFFLHLGWTGRLLS